MAEWYPRSTTPFSELHTPPIRGRSLASSIGWASRSRSRASSSDGSFPPPEEGHSEPGEIGDEYEEEYDSPNLVPLGNLPEPDVRGRRGEGAQALPKTMEVVNPPAQPPPRSASSQDMMNQALPQEFLDAIDLSPIPNVDTEVLPPAAPYFNPLQNNPHHNPFQNTGSRVHFPTQQTGLLIPRSHPSFENLTDQRLLSPTGPRAPEHTFVPNMDDRVISPMAQQPGIPNPPLNSNPFPNMANQTSPFHMGHYTNTPKQQNQRKRKRIESQTQHFSFENMAARLLNPIEHVLQAGGYNIPPRSSSQQTANRTGTNLSASEVEKNQLMFIFLAKLGRDIANSAKHKPLLEMNPLAFSTLPASDEERRQHINDIRQIVNINKIIGGGISACESMIERFRLLRQVNVERINYTRSYIAVLRILPTDVLYLIFDCCVYEAGVSPWTLVAISQQFRREAGGYRKIWASIHLDAMYLGENRYVDFHHICRTVEQLDRAISRSGSFPLIIKIHTCNKAMADRLIQDRPRWFNITYHASLNGADVEQALFPQTFTKAERAATLGIASLEVRWPLDGVRGSHLSGWIKHHTPRRVSFCWHSNFNVPTVSQDAPLDQQWWTQLRTLELVYPGYNGPQSQEDRAPIALAIIKQTRNTVTELKLGNVLWAMTTDQLQLPNLRKLSLVDVEYWWNLVGPGVTELELSPPKFGQHEIEPPHGVEPPAGVKVVFPELKTLRYTATYCGMCGVISAPKLDLLEYHCGKSEGGFIWESDQNANHYPTPCLNLNRLHMYDVQVRYADLIRGMRCLRDLEEIHFYSSQLRVGFLKPMTGTLKELLLPNLTEIVVELASGNGMPEGPRARETYTEIFEKIAEIRKGCGRKWRGHWIVHTEMQILNRLTVKWTTEMGGGTTAFVSPPERPVSKWTVVEVSGSSCHTLAVAPELVAG